MGAYNWIIIENKCPSCKQITTIKCQTHIASSYEGDSRGRFHDKHYNIGEEMNWWPNTHPKFTQWRVNGCKQPNETNSNSDQECCYSSCCACKADLYVVLNFTLNCPINVLSIGKVENWPDMYYK